MHNIAKVFNLEQGGDTRCIIFDNHRPLHLANIHSQHNVVVFDDVHAIEMDILPSDNSDDDYNDKSDNDTSEDEEEEEEEEDDGDDEVMIVPIYVS
jgi:hypothetical protein